MNGTKIDFLRAARLKIGTFLSEGKVEVSLEQLLDKNMLIVKKKLTNVDSDMLRRERNLKDISHQNVITCYRIYAKDNGYNSKDIIIFMEYMDKGTLGHIINHLHSEDRPMNFDQKYMELLAATISFEVLSGLAYMEKKKIYHRDIKPSNICLNKFGEVKLVDFGTSTKLTQTD